MLVSVLAILLQASAEVTNQVFSEKTVMEKEAELGQQEDSVDVGIFTNGNCYMSHDCFHWSHDNHQTLSSRPLLKYT